MAKANLSWELVDNKLVATILATKRKLSFDLTKLFPAFVRFSEVQKNVIAYGLKQKLADKCAREADMKLTPPEMEQELKALWEQLLGGVWRVKAESQTVKLTNAWDSASEAERAVLTKLGLKPKSA